ncbi:hypothetical protein [Lacticaseibacillus brantae]|uniref:Uncharacterized protein n=1 Tax=Lacticaseibacillus brantae DSM 23927 TaxID=1423727 RepID=A0A0R2B0Y9_9LACO|nr:hypothetical protein [Lacticaseibacillus brantae]KRM72725.1 hypothetical protein FC34_GL000435 [Lacticaseibacillus brantae DSM 23927]
MKFSLIKLPALYTLVFLGYRIIELIIASIVHIQSGFSFPAVGATLMGWESYLWWLGAIGLLLHLISYFKSIHGPAGDIWGNLIGACAFIADILVPNYAFWLLFAHLISMMLLLRTTPQTTATANRGEAE